MAIEYLPMEGASYDELIGRWRDARASADHIGESLGHITDGLAASLIEDSPDALTVPVISALAHAAARLNALVGIDGVTAGMVALVLGMAAAELDRKAAGA